MATIKNTGIPKIALWAWSFVGVVAAASLIFIGLSSVQTVLWPLLFATILAVLFKPVSDFLIRKRFRPGLAASLVVVTLVLAMSGVITATVKGIAGQLGEVESAAISAQQTLGITADHASMQHLQSAIAEMAPKIRAGTFSAIVSGIGALVATASGTLLGVIIMYYMLKDGTMMRHSFIRQISARYRDETDAFLGRAFQTLRRYGSGRTIMSLIVALVIGLAALLLGLPLVLTIMVVNFIGGYIPYIGAFVGGGLAVIVALGERGLTAALIMLAVTLASNIVLENFIQPKVLGNVLEIHPLTVLLATILGGLLMGIAGLILAVPAYIVAADAVRLWRNGVRQAARIK